MESWMLFASFMFAAPRGCQKGPCRVDGRCQRAPRVAMERAMNDFGD